MAAQLIVVVTWWFLWLIPAPSRVKFWRIIYYMLLTALLLYGGVGTLVDWYNQKYPMKRVIQPTLTYLGPDMSYTASGKVEKDDIVRVVCVANSWSKVEKQAVIGWVPAAYLSDE